MPTESKRYIVSPATRAFIREARKVKGYSWFDFLHGYVYGRWPYLYIAIGTGEHRSSKYFQWLVAGVGKLLPKRPLDEGNTHTFADGYHGKVAPLDTARQLVTINEPVAIPDLEQVIPYKRARSIVLENPDRIVVLDCPCRSGRANPCLPLDVCLVIGEPFASFILEHHPDRARRITQEEAVAILEAEEERGHVHHAFFKDAMLERFYAICNCCACCCGAMQAHRNGTPMLASSGYVAVVDENECLACGTCAEFCQFEAIALDNVAQVIREACMGCGVCVGHCTQEAIALERAPEKGEPLEIHKLMAKGD